MHRNPTFRYQMRQERGGCPTPSTLAQSKERMGSNFAIWQPWPPTPFIHSEIEVSKDVGVLLAMCVYNVTAAALSNCAVRPSKWPVLYTMTAHAVQHEFAP